MDFGKPEDVEKFSKFLNEDHKNIKTNYK